ncbi:U3 small nucleolar RNA-associated protein 6 [Dictyocaulus viviparus]|uniref:U3 small nucleolar RNA-associated protein 6 n=1 Tax=Dictyocaulus viviparus TaxID=29172 RepID=A0A0D8XZK2_DICVI|nr:U3 small nucleolar RNA-associated protein 6 [Dictyocaulus viviparus]
MGEFVEHSIESLLSTFEEIGDVQLLSKEELNVFIKRCRQYEYRLNKHEKTPRDFNLFAEYLCDFLTLLKSRRKKLQYYHKKELIERPIRKKVASIYRRAADRFQGNWTQWEKLIKFLKKNKMRRELSAAYTRALQASCFVIFFFIIYLLEIYGKNESLRSEFALWQFFEAASPQNARTQTLAAIRLFPRSPTLYVTLFSIEIHFVDKVLKRRKFITEGKSKENQSDKIEIRNEDENDHITNLNVAKVVVEQALSSVPVHDAPGMLVEMWKECGKVKLVPNVEKIRLFIEDRLNEFNNEHTRLFEIELGCNEGASKFDMFDKALKKTPSEMMHRFYLQWLREIPRDAFVEFKIREVLHELCENGWMNETDWSDLENEIRHIQEQYGANFIKKCLKKRPQSVVLWDIYLENCLRDGTMFPDEFRAQCNTALEKVDPNDSFPIWRHAIEYTITSDPRQIEHVLLFKIVLSVQMLFSVV